MRDPRGRGYYTRRSLEGRGYYTRRSLEAGVTI